MTIDGESWGPAWDSALCPDQHPYGVLSSLLLGATQENQDASSMCQGVAAVPVTRLAFYCIYFICFPQTEKKNKPENHKKYLQKNNKK